MGGWCSEELTPKQNETAAMVMMKTTERLGEKRTVPRRTIAIFS
jgi:hypothetical protein